MNLSACAARWARVTPGKLHVALPLLIMGVFYWVSPSVQNVLHVPAYAALAWAWRCALGAWLRVAAARAIGACAFASAYGIFDEWHQSFVPGRYASLTDVTLDIAGAVLGIWLAARIGSRAGTVEPQMHKGTRG